MDPMYVAPGRDRQARRAVRRGLPEELTPKRLVQHVAFVVAFVAFAWVTSICIGSDGYGYDAYVMGMMLKALAVVESVAVVGALGWVGWQQWRRNSFLQMLADGRIVQAPGGFVEAVQKHASLAGLPDVPMDELLVRHFSIVVASANLVSQGRPGDNRMLGIFARMIVRSEMAIAEAIRLEQELTHVSDALSLLRLWSLFWVQVA